MVTVEIFQDEAAQVLGFKVTGHAGFKPHGEDIVCAGISILTQTAVMGLLKYLPLEPHVDKESGFLTCLLPERLTVEEMERAQIILQTMLLGIEATEQSYSKYIRIHKRRWTECF